MVAPGRLRTHYLETTGSAASLRDRIAWMAMADQSDVSLNQHLKRRDGVINGVFALAGVVIGALVTAGITYLGDRNGRIADQRTAQRLVAAEIRADTQKLFYVHEFGREGKSGSPTAVEWTNEALTLARNSSLSVWTTVSTFYYQVAVIEPSLATTCVRKGTWDYAIEYAKSGNAALQALGQRPISVPNQSVTQTVRARVLSCRAVR